MVPEGTVVANVALTVVVLVTGHGTEAVMVVSGTLLGGGATAEAVTETVGAGSEGGVYPAVRGQGIAVMIAGFWGIYAAQIPAKNDTAFSSSASEPQDCTQATTLLTKPSNLQ
jgi:hypothetical protein